MPPEPDLKDVEHVSTAEAKSALMAGWKKCHHIFWKDRNPETCMNCGKTERQLVEESLTERIN